MLVAKNLQKTYQQKRSNGFWRRSSKTLVPAVKSVSISIEKGKITGLLGINGAGKTTTIKMLSGLIAPDGGTIEVIENARRFDGIRHYQALKQRINMVTGGERNLYWRLSAKQNLAYFGALYGLKGKVLAQRIEQLLEVVELTANADQPVEQFSKGMKQRLQIARGLINQPDYLFLDEPTLGLDIGIAQKLRQQIKQLKADTGILLTTHYIAEAEALCDDIIVLNQGEIIAQGTPAQLKQQLTFEPSVNVQGVVASPAQQLRLTNWCLAHGYTLQTGPDALSVQGCAAAALATQLSELSINFQQLGMAEPSLEDALLALSQEAA